MSNVFPYQSQGHLLSKFYTERLGTQINIHLSISCSISTVDWCAFGECAVPYVCDVYCFYQPRYIYSQLMNLL
jgi:hypothetical protein